MNVPKEDNYLRNKVGMLVTEVYFAIKRANPQMSKVEAEQATARYLRGILEEAL